MKKALITLLILAVVAAGGYFGYQYYQSAQTAEASADTESPYSRVVIGTGSLNKSVTGTGSLTISQTENVALDYAVTVTGTIVSAGDQVTAGDALLEVDQDLLRTTINTLQAELDTTESDMASISSDYTSNAYVRAPVSGVLKEIYVQEGDKLEDVMAEKGSLALMSLDGRMYVEVPVVEGVEVTSQVKVKYVANKTPLDGVVKEIKDGIAKVTFPDYYVDEGQEVEVFLKQTSMGTAPAYINLPYQLTSNEKGYVHISYMEKNDKKYKGNRILYLINVPVSAEYTVLQRTREKLSQEITDATAMLASGKVASPIDGIVSTLVEPSSTEQAAKTTLVSLYAGDQKEMIVTVDELDIVHVQVGQTVQITMDAITDKVYTGTVAHVSQIGAAESGVTVYDVTIDLEGDEQLRIGMNGTATIMVRQVNDVLLVPIGAMNTSRDGQYVWLYDENQQTSSDEPGTKTFITTGMSNENFAEVTSGLSEGDVVLVTRTANTNNPGNFNMMNMGGDRMIFTMEGRPGGGNGNGGGNRTNPGGGTGGGAARPGN